MLGVDRVRDLLDLPTEVRFHQRILDDAVAPDFKPALAERGSHCRQVATGDVSLRMLFSRRSRRVHLGDAVHHLNRLAIDRAVAVFTADFDRRADLAVELRVSVNVLHEVAIDAVHPLLEVDVEQMDRIPLLLLPQVLFQFLKLLKCPLITVAVQVACVHRVIDGDLPLLGRGIGNPVSKMVQVVPLAVLLEDRLEDPAVTVKVGEVRLAQGRIQLRDVPQKVWVRGIAAGRDVVRVVHVGLRRFL